MDLDATTMVTIIAGGTTDYLAEFMPIFTFVAGILIAFGIMYLLVDMLLNRGRRSDDDSNIFDDNIKT